MLSLPHLWVFLSALLFGFLVSFHLKFCAPCFLSISCAPGLSFSCAPLFLGGSCTCTSCFLAFYTSCILLFHFASLFLMIVFSSLSLLSSTACFLCLSSASCFLSRSLSPRGKFPDLPRGPWSTKVLSTQNQDRMCTRATKMFLPPLSSCHFISLHIFYEDCRKVTYILVKAAQ